MGSRDVERGEQVDAAVEDESQALLSHVEEKDVLPQVKRQSAILEKLHHLHGISRVKFMNLAIAFLSGIAATLIMQYFLMDCPRDFTGHEISSLADPDAGSTTRHNFPPTNPTNAFPSLFPTEVGYHGATPTGGEAAVVATAPSFPAHTEVPNLVAPESIPKLTVPWIEPDSKRKEFDLFKSWGNLSPWYSLPSDAFGLKKATSGIPDGCEVTGLHFVHRHGARYPTSWTSYAGPAGFATRLHQNPEQWSAKGHLKFLNNWTYKLGEELLTPFGRQQMYDLGVSLRLKYGYLLEDFTDSNALPVFRTESQDRMLASAHNFALGFFGWPLDGKYQEVITIEADGYNNTLAPYYSCPSAKNSTKADRGTDYLKEWTAVYLKDARKRLQHSIKGYNLTIEDVYAMQQMCPYETVALGYSKFCELFTEEEWEGFAYSLDVYFWYNSGFGSPVARIQGIGYIQELVSRLTHTPITVHNSSTNATIVENPILFPLNQSLYVDATHEVVVVNIITALNLTNFAANGPLPSDRIVKNRSFDSSQLAPFGTNIQFQLLSCNGRNLPTTPQIRIIINDAVTPLTGIEGCKPQKEGMCGVDEFVAGQRKIIQETDVDWGCRGDWAVPPTDQWETVTGDPPKKPQ